MISEGRSGALHHIGISVDDLSRSLTFWTSYLQVEPLWTRLLDGAYLESVTGIPGVRIQGAMVPLPDGRILELLQYLTGDTARQDMASSRPGNVHIAFEVEDIEASWDFAMSCNATPLSAAPVAITTGPNTGAWVAYARDPDGVIIELFMPPPRAEF